MTYASAVINDAIIPSTSGSCSSPSVTMDCIVDHQPTAPLAEYVFALPDIDRTTLDDQSVVEYLISVPDNTMASPVVQCVVDGVIVPNSLQLSRTAVLPEDSRPYPVAERVHSSAVKRKSKAKSATLITGSPFKAQLMEVNKGKGASLSNRSKRSLTSKFAAEKKRSLNSNPKSKRRNVNPNVASTTVRGQSSRENNVDENDDCCGNCGFLYGEPNDPLIDDEWFKCVHCVKWCHFSCGTARKKTFTCHKCLYDKLNDHGTQ